MPLIGVRVCVRAPDDVIGNATENDIFLVLDHEPIFKHDDEQDWFTKAVSNYSPIEVKRRLFLLFYKL